MHKTMPVDGAILPVADVHPVMSWNLKTLEPENPIPIPSKG